MDKVTIVVPGLSAQVELVTVALRNGQPVWGGGVNVCWEDEYYVLRHLTEDGRWGTPVEGTCLFLDAREAALALVRHLVVTGATLTVG